MITSIILEWENWGLCCGDDVCSTKLTVFKNKHSVIYEEFNGRDECLSRQEGFFESHYGDRFFWILDESLPALTEKRDYSVPVCDGSCWRLKLRHSDRTITQIKGTVEYPPNGKRLEREMLQLCEAAHITTPQMFGCDGVSFTAASQFLNKWIKIFDEVPPTANYQFEEEFGNECLALGFEMDCGKAFEAAFSNERVLYDLREFRSVIGQVDDAELLGSAIISKWRAITHWSYGESGFSEENKPWFLLALNRLRELI